VKCCQINPLLNTRKIQRGRTLCKTLGSLLICVATVTAPVIAQGDESAQSSSWTFRGNVYGWLPDAPATINVDGEEVVDVPEDLDTILDSADALAMFELQAQKEQLVLFANVIYYKGDYDEGFDGPVTMTRRKFRLEEEVTTIKYGVGYEFGPWDVGDNNLSTLTLTPWVAGFYFHDNWSLRVTPDSTPGGGRVSGTFEFNTPMVGLASRSRLSQDWGLFVSYGYGGWDVDDVEEIYDFIGLVNYQFKMGDVPAHTFFGYRYLYIDWEDDPEQLLLTIKGPLIGIGWEF
jgi:hypothetical protein